MENFLPTESRLVVYHMFLQPISDYRNRAEVTSQFDFTDNFQNTNRFSFLMHKVYSDSQRRWTHFLLAPSTLTATITLSPPSWKH